MTPRYHEPLPRIAFVVFNTMTHDNRVIREAQAAMEAGATVRVFAYGSQRLGLEPAGLAVVDGVEVDRIPLTSLNMLIAGVLPLLKWVRSLVGGSRPARPAPVAEAPDDSAPVVPAKPAADDGAASSSSSSWLLRQAEETDRFIRRFSFWYRTQRAIRAWKPDLVHAHDANTLMVVGYAARRLGVPFVYDSHELWTMRQVFERRTLAVRLEGPIERFWIRRARGVITVSPSIAQWLRDTYRLRRTPALVRNSPPFGGSVPARESGRLRELAGLGPETSVVAFCGKISPSRGIERGVEALVHLDERVHFVLMGPGSAAQLAALAQLAERLGVSDRVHVVGSVPGDQVSAALADADVSLVLPEPVTLNYAYSLPNKLFESMQAGVPVLVSDTPDASALVREWNLGEVVATDAPATEVAAMISKVIEGGARFREAAVIAAGQVNWQTEVVHLLEVHNAALQAAS
ncbi:MAG: glycosyltransferase [Marmoricola sp.]